MSGLCRAASAPAAYASRTVLPPSLQSSLPAGWLAFTGRELNPLDRCNRFQIIHPPFLDLAWRKGSFIFEPPSSFTSLDHLIGAGKQHLRDHDAESLRRPEIDHEFEFRRRPNGKIRRLRTAKDATGI